MLNNDIHSLIKQYKRYKKQSRSDSIGKIVAWILIPIVIGFALFKFINSNNEEPIKTIEPQIKESNDIFEQEENNNSEQTVKTSIQKERKESIKEEPIKEEPIKEESIKDENLQRLLSYYTKRKSYSSAISIASYYYSYQKYENSVKWAIRASKINKNKDQPWIIYAKSKSALGNDTIAKKALETYLKFNESSEAEVLLKTLENKTTK